MSTPRSRVRGIGGRAPPGEVVETVSSVKPKAGSKAKDEEKGSDRTASPISDGSRSPSSKALIPSGRTGEDRDNVAILIACVFMFITIYMYPGTQVLRDGGGESAPSLGYVFYYGWITAISTGVGVLPFYFISETSEYWIGVCNALAGGMMTAASYSLAYEGIAIKEDAGSGSNWRLSADGLASRGLSGLLHLLHADVGAEEFINSSAVRTVLGLVLGILFIVVTGKVLETREDLSIGGIAGASAAKMVLIIFVMTLHSLSEGIGIGVAFGASNWRELGKFISTSLAVHNIPEGLAVALVLFPMKMSKLRVALWAIFTSLPQPLMALPAYMFVKEFLPLLPVGLGFASGAMAYVALVELLPEALEGVKNKGTVAAVGIVSCGAMLVIQDSLHG